MYTSIVLSKISFIFCPENNPANPFPPKSFKSIAKGINEFWKKILKKSDLKYKKIVFPEKSKIWDKK